MSGREEGGRLVNPRFLKRPWGWLSILLIQLLLCCSGEGHWVLSGEGDSGVLSPFTGRDHQLTLLAGLVPFLQNAQS